MGKNRQKENYFNHSETITQPKEYKSASLSFIPAIKRFCALMALFFIFLLFATSYEKGAQNREIERIKVSMYQMRFVRFSESGGVEKYPVWEKKIKYKIP